MNDSFPKYQFSIFDKNGNDCQYVVRGNDWKLFLEDVEAVKSTVINHEHAHDPIMAVTKDVVTHGCKTCAAEGIVSETEYKHGTKQETGKSWAGYFCKRVKEHVEWVHMTNK